MKKTIVVCASDELIVEEYLKEWNVNYQLKGQGFLMDITVAYLVAKRLSDKCILHVVI